MLGEHTFDLLHDLLGLTEEVAAPAASGAIE
jgi:hypothetical protein